jgi:hypothetical protein
MEIDMSINDALKILKVGLKGHGLDIKDVSVANGTTLKISFVAKSDKSVDVKAEVVSAMSFAHGFLKDEETGEVQYGLEFMACEVDKAAGGKLMHVISPMVAVRHISNGEAIEWLQKSIFQDHTQDYVLSVAKKRVSELENGMRGAIREVLEKKHGAGWWNAAVSNKVRQSTEGMYLAKEGVSSTDGNKLIYFTFLLDLRKIVVSNWRDFDRIFKNQARFTTLLDDLNKIRRAEAHNREISDQEMKDLEAIHGELMNQVAVEVPNVVPQYLVDNWRLQLSKVFESNIKRHQFVQPKPGDLESAKSSVKGQIGRYADLETQVKSILVPAGKADLHNELVGKIGGVKDSLIAILDAAENDRVGELEQLKKSSDKANAELQKFRETYLMSEL